MKSYYTHLKVGIIAACFTATFLFTSCSSTTHTSGIITYPYGASNYSAVYTPPSWAPSSENLSGVRYYFLTDCDAYYDAATQQFYSQDNNGSWISSGSVPTGCSGMDLSNATPCS